MDHIEIVGLEVWAHHGVLPHEAQLGQRFAIDVRLGLDLAPAGTSDQLDDTIDYGTLAQAIHDRVAGERHQLLETVAARVADLALDDPRVDAVEVTVHKPAAPLAVPASEVRVTVRRTRD